MSEPVPTPAETYGVGPVQNRPRGIGTTWALDVPRRVVRDAWDTDPLPPDGWSTK